jgi:hypothetical protein
LKRTRYLVRGGGEGEGEGGVQELDEVRRKAEGLQVEKISIVGDINNGVDGQGGVDAGNIGRYAWRRAAASDDDEREHGKNSAHLAKERGRAKKTARAPDLKTGGGGFFTAR